MTIKEVLETINAGKTLVEFDRSYSYLREGRTGAFICQDCKDKYELQVTNLEDPDNFPEECYVKGCSNTAKFRVEGLVKIEQTILIK